ncbi:Carbon-nitrogen hydrolase [Coemansia erecta]|nr:Carbon-nitrogen hydrolase [Coemansia erecta]KAJ2888832.1 Carbon-nitrogen hydrolase [Coemansia asiatica]
MTDQLHELAHPQHTDEYDAKIMEASKHAEYITEQEAVAQDETYAAEYAEYDMTEVEGMEHHTDPSGQADVYGNGSSILATAQDNADDQMIDDQHAGYYEQVDEDHEEGEKVISVDEDGNQIMVDHIEQDSEEHHQHQQDHQDHQEHSQEHDEHHDGQDHEHEHEHEHEHIDEHEHVDTDANEHRQHYGEQDEHQMYDAGQVVYSMVASDDADTNNSSSLDALSQAVTSSVNRYSNDLVTQKNAATQHEEDASQDQGGHSHSSTPLSASITTPMKFKVSSGVPKAGSHTPAKRPSSSRKDGSNSRLKSRVWGWYDILADGQRQCKFCTQKYGRLTATTILARHYHSRHDPNPETMRHMATPTPRRSVSHSISGNHQSTASAVHSQHHEQPQQQQQQHINISQAAAAAAAAAVAAAVANGTAAPADASDPQASHLFHVQSSDGSTAEYPHQGTIRNDSPEDILRSVSEAVSQTAYEDNQIIMQDGFSTMMTAPLSRISLASAPRAVAAVAQFCAQADIQKNIHACIDMISTAARRGARMIFLPEASDFITESRSQSLQQAQPLDGSFVKEIQQAAKDNGIWVSVGVHEQHSVNGLPYNTNAVISDEGTLVSLYRKLHLFDVNVKDGPRLLESSVSSRGDSVSDIVDTPVGKLGLSVCYDMRFPELAQNLRMRGAQLLCYPSAFTEPTGAAHWEILLRARAVETQTYVFAAAQIGKHNSKRSSYGDAMIVDPWGSVIARCSRNSTDPTLALAEVNLDLLEKIRREMPVFKHRRTDIFG